MTAIDWASLKDEFDNSYTPVWNPEEGDTVMGVIIDAETETSQYGAFTTYTLEQQDGSTIKLKAHRTVLRKEITEAGARGGDIVMVRYNGAKPLKGRDGVFHDYQVKLKRDPNVAFSHS